MKKFFSMIILLTFFSTLLSAAGDIPFFKSLFMGDEEYVRQEILKCKDVEKVELEVGYQDDDDLLYNVHVYLKGHRYLCFENVTLSFYKRLMSNKYNYITLKQINDLTFLTESFKANQFRDSFLYYSRWIQCGEIQYLSKLSSDLKASNMLEIIENINEVYTFIACLPQIQQDYTSGGCFEYPYNKSFQVPIEFDNEVPVSVIEKKRTYDSKFMIENWYEEAYKFYKCPIKDAKNNEYYRKIFEY